MTTRNSSHRRFDKHISQEELKRAIQNFSRQLREAAQVAKRLRQLITPRFKAIQSEAQTRSRGKSALMSLNDERFVSFIEELVEVRCRALEARVLYETHMMLLEARQSTRDTRFSASPRAGKQKAGAGDRIPEPQERQPT